MEKQAKRGCVGPFLGCLGAGIVILAGIVWAIYMFAPKLAASIDRNFLPWLESQGRAFEGKLTLQPLHRAIAHSELTREEKQNWEKFLEEKWELAKGSHDQKLQRSVLIDASRDVLGTYPGLYYGMLAVAERDFKETTLTRQQIEAGQKLISVVTNRMLDGAYSADELAPVKPLLLSVLSIWRVEKQNAQGQREEDSNLRDFFRALLKLSEQKERHGDKQARNLKPDFAKELASFKQRILSAEAEAAK